MILEKFEPGRFGDWLKRKFDWREEQYHIQQGSLQWCAAMAFNVMAHYMNTGKAWDGLRQWQKTMDESNLSKDDLINNAWFFFVTDIANRFHSGAPSLQDVLHDMPNLTDKDKKDVEELFHRAERKDYTSGLPKSDVPPQTF